MPTSKRSRIRVTDSSLGACKWFLFLLSHAGISATPFFLKQNKIKGAVLDVFEAEPIPQGSEIWDMENVIITPHIAGPSFSGDEATKDKIWKICFENIESYLRGGTLKNVVDFDRGY